MIKQRLISLSRDKNKKNFIIYGIGQAFNLLSPLIVAPLVISVCRESGFGKIGLGFALALFLILIVDYAFEIKGTKLASENRDSPDNLEKLLSTTIIIKSILFVAAFGIAVLLIFFIPFFNQEKLLFFLSLAIVFAQIFNPGWFLQGIENFLLVSIINIGSKVTYVLLVIFFIKQSHDYILANFFLGMSSFFFYIGCLAYIIIKYQFRIYIPKLQEIQIILKRDFTFCISQLFLSARQLSPLVLTGYFLGFAVAGQYKIIEQIITLFRTFSQVYLKFFYAKACYKFKFDIREGFQFWKKYAFFNIGAIAILLLLILIFSTDLLRFFNLSESSIAGIGQIFRISLIIPFLIPFSLALEQLMFINDKSKIYVKITIFASIINIALILLTIVPLQLYGIMLSLLIAEILFIGCYFYNSYLYTKHSIKNENHA
ncbi:MAG TPA: oligosaccharide flippase family protein [Flavobacterium sp.]|nr:oligosaccharide flippase family protein [Flavobacterium sp.]